MECDTFSLQCSGCANKIRSGTSLPVLSGTTVVNAVLFAEIQTGVNFVHKDVTLLINVRCYCVHAGTARCTTRLEVGLQRHHTRRPATGHRTSCPWRYLAARSWAVTGWLHTPAATRRHISSPAAGSCEALRATSGQVRTSTARTGHDVRLVVSRLGDSWLLQQATWWCWTTADCINPHRWSNTHTHTLQFHNQ